VSFRSHRWGDAQVNGQCSKNAALLSAIIDVEERFSCVCPRSYVRTMYRSAAGIQESYSGVFGRRGRSTDFGTPSRRRANACENCQINHLQQNGDLIILEREFAYHILGASPLTVSLQTDRVEGTTKIALT
jgi:hypothetical protein